MVTSEIGNHGIKRKGRIPCGMRERERDIMSIQTLVQMLDEIKKAVDRLVRRARERERQNVKLL